MKIEVMKKVDAYGALRVYAGVTAAIVRITPALAEEYLKHNQKNRPVSRSHLQHLVEVFKRGDMILNGETIIFAADGTLLNGQHRLLACVQSGISFDSIVIRGIDTEAFSTLDGGRTRKTSEVLGMSGEANCTNLASAVQGLLSFASFGGCVRLGGLRVRATPQIAARVLHRHPCLRDSVSAMRRAGLYCNQQGYTLHYLFWTVDKNLADDFVEILANGVRVPSDIGRPFVRLREQLVSSPVKNETREAYAAKVIKAFNAERAGERPMRFSFSDREEFPRIDGLDYDALIESLVWAHV